MGGAEGEDQDTCAGRGCRERPLCARRLSAPPQRAESKALLSPFSKGGSSESRGPEKV